MSNPAENRDIDPTVFELGVSKDGKRSIKIDTGAQTNFHIGIMGYSGSGKTHTMKRLIRHYYHMGAMPIIFDVHGDFQDLDQMGLPVKHFDFAHEGGHTINPLKMHVGGPHLAIDLFTQCVRLFNSSIGKRQEDDIKKLLNELYQERGFINEDPSTWGNKSPTLTDLHNLIHNIMVTDDDVGCISTVDYVRKELRKDSGDIPSPDQLGDEILSKLAESRKYARRVWNRDRLEGLEAVVSSMLDTQLFGEDMIRMSPKHVNRIRLNTLSPQYQLIIIKILLERIFTGTMRREKKDNPKAPRYMVFLDEGKLAMQVAKKDQDAANRIATEGRGFGIGMVIGSQSPRHFTDDIKDNLGTTILLPVNTSNYGEACSKFKLNQRQLQELQPRSEGLVQISNKPFETVKLFPNE